MKVYFINLGCVKNLVDTEGVASLLLQSGWSVSQDLMSADAVVINTCAFIKEAVDEGFATIEEFEDKGKDVVVIGCLVQRYKDSLLRRFPWIKGLVSVGNYEEVPRILKKGESLIKSTPSPCFLKRDLLFTLPHLAYLKIADGCDNRCAYCLIPSLRGGYRSRRIEDIVNEARQLADLGVKELVIVAQDTTFYGKDIYGRHTLPSLLKKLERISTLRWIRVLYMHPKHLSEKLIHTIAESEKIVPYFDLPLQHISDRVLSLMRRGVDERSIRKLLENIKRKIPEAKLRTTLLVGHPGEGDREFEHLYSFIKEGFFDYVGVFCYSKEKGTLSATYKEQVPPKTAQERKDAIMKLTASVSSKKLKEYKGKVIDAVIEGERDDLLTARPYFFAPSVDGVLFLKGKAKVGDFVRAKVTETTSYDLYGVVLK